MPTTREEWQKLMARWNALDDGQRNRAIGWLASADAAEFTRALESVEGDKADA